MRLRSVYGIALGTAMLAGCAGSGGPAVVNVLGNETVPVLEEICAGTASPIAAICRGVDIVSTLTTLPSAQSEITYSQTDAFDSQLHASMKGAVPEITVTFADTVPTYVLLSQVPRRPSPDAPQLVFWQAKVLNSGGSIAVCEKAPYESILAMLGSIFVNRLVEITDNWLTYRPARNYNSVLIVVRTNFEEEPEYDVERVHYRLRSGEDSLECPAGTLQYAVLARPN